jgi:hypothetical protein
MVKSAAGIVRGSEPAAKRHQRPGLKQNRYDVDLELNE